MCNIKSKSAPSINDFLTFIKSISLLFILIDIRKIKIALLCVNKLGIVKLGVFFTISNIRMQIQQKDS